MKKLWIFLGGHYIIGLFLFLEGGGGGHFYPFLLRQGTEWESFWGSQNFKYLLEMPDIPDIFISKK